MEVKNNILQGYPDVCREVRGFPRDFRLKPLALLLGLAFFQAAVEGSDTFEFDDSMLVGSAKKQNIIARFNQANVIEPGTYQVDIYVNNTYFGRESLVFSTGEQGQISACFTKEMLLEIGLLPDHFQDKNSEAESCLHLGEQVAGASERFDFARLRLDLLIPQAQMQRTARGTVATSELSPGETALFANYDSNYYRSKAADSTMSSLYLGLNSGVNLGLWQFRQQSIFTHITSSNGSNMAKWNLVRNYLQRPLPAIGSQLTLGDSFTAGTLLSSLSFRGIQLETDERMLPDSQRGYAPIVRGIAATTARVSISQSGREIYQTTVAPGAFVIDDLYPTSYQGDLLVEVREADGRVASFTVPFSAVPDSIRAGKSRISMAAGEVRNTGDGKTLFGDVNYQRGLSNAITANTSVRVSSDYQALLGGAVFANQFGALGFNGTYSRAGILGNRLNGWRLGATYSRTFTPTATTLALAGYRYSTKGYRDLNDVLGLRKSQVNSENWSSNTYQQSNQFVATLSQGLGRYGLLSFSGATSSYRGGRGRDTQYQMTYSGSYNNISYNLSLGRQQTGRDFGVNDTSSGTSETVAMLSFSMPLGRGGRVPQLSAGVTHNAGADSSTSYQTAIAGTLGEGQSLSYSVNGAFNPAGNGTSLGLSMNKQLPVMAVGANVSQGEGYTQGGASVRGAVVAHRGGVTLGPYLGDTFALVEAKGMQGAKVIGGMGAKIDHFGYAVVPSLVPYRYNSISLDTQGIENQNVELTESQQRIAPYAGSTAKVSFNTLEGYALLIKQQNVTDQELPLGSNVYDSDGAIVGLVGQSNQVYARAAALQGKLRVKWGDAVSEECIFSYDLRNQDVTQPLLRLELPCSRNAG